MTTTEIRAEFLGIFNKDYLEMFAKKAQIAIVNKYNVQVQFPGIDNSPTLTFHNPEVTADELLPKLKKVLNSF